MNAIASFGTGAPSETAGGGMRRVEPAGPLHLPEPAQNDAALQGADVIDEENALKMIHLVLEAGREQPVGVQLLGRVVLIEVAHMDARRPLDLGELLRQREAPFLERRLLVGCPDDLRV